MADTLTDNFRLTKISRRKGWAEAMNENIDRLGKLFCIDNDGNFWFVQNAIYDRGTDIWSQPNTAVASTAMKMDMTGAVTMLSCAAGNSMITWVNDISHRMPSGVIVMWSGSIVNIPSGWALCDGMNGTPDLRDQFVVGAGDSYEVGDTGGEETHTLITAEMPAHSHSLPVYHGNAGSSIGALDWGYSSAGTMSVSGAGGGSSHENRPPYYALCFIMLL